LVERLLSPAGFGLALLFFLLPFLTVSCVVAEGDQQAVVDYTFTGLDLATGGAPEVSGTLPNDDGSPMPVDGVTDEEGFHDEFGRPVQALVVVAAGVILAGMLGGFALPAALRAGATVAASVGAIVLVVVEVFAVAPAQAADELASAIPTGPVSTHTTPAIGFYLTVAVLLALIVRELVAGRRQAGRTDDAPTAEQQPHLRGGTAGPHPPDR
jgi:hypothetical protein